jgi:hypothetical protein
MKRAISIRLDTDLLSWFKKEFPDGYQIEIQNVLKSYAKVRQEKSMFIAGRAQQAYLQFHARCFWHAKKDLKITPDLVLFVLEGLRKHGGREGYFLANEIEAEKTES